jgi:hypothetical protein
MTTVLSINGVRFAFSLLFAFSQFLAGPFRTARPVKESRFPVCPGVTNHEEYSGGAVMNAFRGTLRKHPTNPRYFTDDSGQAIYLTGSHAWAVLQDMWLEGTPRRNMFR